MKTILPLLLAFALILIFTSIAFAQGPPPHMPGDPSQAPIDGGLALLAAAGGGYALKKLRDRKKMNDNIDM